MTDSKDKTIIDTWQKRFAQDKKAHSSWREEAKRIQAIYDQEPTETQKRPDFNILWSNTQIQHGALYSNTAKPDIRKRYSESIPGAKEAGQILERAIMYCQDITDFDDSIDRTVDDGLVAGMGQTRVRLITETRPIEEGEEGGQEIIHQCVPVEHISWRNFGWQPAVRWTDVNWSFIKHKIHKKTVEKTYGVTLVEKDGQELPDMVDIYECFDKKAKSIIIIAQDQEKPLKVTKDKLNLKDFYPFTKPIFFFSESKSFTPKPEFIYFESQADSLNNICKRIKAITAAVKEVGLYDASLGEELGSLTKKADGHLEPIENLIGKLDGADWRNAVATLPLEEKMKVLGELKVQKEAMKEEIYEITGISDIVRGATHASESATAQSMKGNYADMRFSRKRKSVNTHIRNVFRLMAEIIAEHFTAEILTKMTGLEVSPEIMELLKDEVTRNFVIDVESDSTIAADEAHERESKLEFLKAVVDYTNTVIPSVQSGAMPMTMAKEILLMVISGWKHGRALEDLINSLGDENSPEGQIQALQQQMQEMQQQLEQSQMEAQQYAEQGQQIQEQAQGQIEETQKAMEQIQGEAQKLAEENEQLNIQVLGQEQEVKKADAKYKNAQANKANADADKTRREVTEGEQGLDGTSDQLQQIVHGLAQGVQAVEERIDALHGSKKSVSVIRDENGRMMGAEISDAIEQIEPEVIE